MATSTAADAGVDVVQTAFEAFGRGDLEAFGAKFHDDATWDHRNDDRFGGVHAGRDAIVAFIAESGQLTQGTLRAAPEAILSDGQGRVAVVVRLTGSRPDGRTLDSKQVLLCAVDGDRMRSVDQFIGDPAAVTAFWA
jgi:ketosteroid isomerase-like protein